MHGRACHREVIVDCSHCIFLTNGNTLLENECHKAAETRLQELTVSYALSLC